MAPAWVCTHCDLGNIFFPHDIVFPPFTGNQMVEHFLFKCPGLDEIWIKTAFQDTPQFHTAFAPELDNHKEQSRSSFWHQLIKSFLTCRHKEIHTTIKLIAMCECELAGHILHFQQLFSLSLMCQRPVVQLCWGEGGWYENSGLQTENLFKWEGRLTSG